MRVTRRLIAAGTLALGAAGAFPAGLAAQVYECITRTETITTTWYYSDGTNKTISTTTRTTDCHQIT